MKTLYKNENPSYCSETFLHNEQKFKIVSKNGNCYYYLDVYIYTQNGDLAEIACKDDIKDIIHVDYHHDDERRVKYSLRNIKLAKEYVQAIY